MVLMMEVQDAGESVRALNDGMLKRGTYGLLDMALVGVQNDGMFKRGTGRKTEEEES